MPNNFKIDQFEALSLKRANKKLDKHVLSASLHQKTNDAYKKSVFKESLWEKFLGLFRR